MRDSDVDVRDSDVDVRDSDVDVRFRRRRETQTSTLESHVDVKCLTSTSESLTSTSESSASS